jgi:hypothetical protein
MTNAAAPSRHLLGAINGELRAGQAVWLLLTCKDTPKSYLQGSASLGQEGRRYSMLYLYRNISGEGTLSGWWLDSSLPSVSCLER